MKKQFSVLLVLALALSILAGCGAKEPASAPVTTMEGTPTEIIEKIYAAHKAVDLSLVTMDVDLSDGDAVLYNLGLSSADKLDSAAVSETMLGQPYSMVVVKLKDAADAAATAKAMYDGIDTRKWICVAADTKTAASYADVAVFFMVNSDFAGEMSVESFLEAFRSVCGSDVNVID